MARKVFWKRIRYNAGELTIRLPVLPLSKAYITYRRIIQN
jgi:hypothetical protein